MIKDFLKSRKGQILISIIWGIGLAALFRRGCANNKCLVIKGPNPEEVAKSIYKSNGKCYKYSPYITRCNETNVNADSGTYENSFIREFKHHVPDKNWKR